MNVENYFDNAATTPVDPGVVQAMLPYFSERWGNANSLHDAGREALDAIEQARARIAALIGAEDPSEIVFTSGATEANNWILHAFPNAAVSPFEHSSIYEPAREMGLAFLANEGYKLNPPSGADLVSVMLVNNETGAIFSPEFLGGGAKVHSDVTQAVGKIPVEVSRYDFASFSAHKFYGPKGVGALYIRGLEPIGPFLKGGEQEHGLRAGTLNVPGIVGMGAAAALAMERLEEDYSRVERLRAIVLEELGGLEDWIELGRAREWERGGTGERARGKAGEWESGGTEDGRGGEWDDSENGSTRDVDSSSTSSSGQSTINNQQSTIHDPLSAQSTINNQQSTINNPLSAQSTINNQQSTISPYILSLSFDGVQGETLVIELDRQGYGISSGAACSSKSTEPSHVLRALNLSDNWIRGAIRISFGRFNTEESANRLGESLRKTVKSLRTMGH